MVHRYAERLALDVPERLIDAGDRTHENRAAAIERAAVHGLPVIVDARGIFADELLADLGDRGFDAARAAFDHGLAPADEAFVRLDLEEHPARGDAIGGELGDFHCDFFLKD